MRNELNDGFNLLRHIEEHLKNPRNLERIETTEKWKNKIVSTQDGVKYWNTCFRARKSILKICQKYIEKNGSNLSIPIDISTENACIDLLYVKLLRNIGITSDAAVLLNKINTKEKSNESYTKSREEIKLQISLLDLDNALNLANFYSQSDNFTKEATSEFRRLKGKIYQSLENYPMALRCYNNASKMNSKNLHIFFDLGRLLSSMYTKPTPAQASEIMCAFLVGVQHNIEKCKIYIPRILNLLEICENPERFSDQFERISSASYSWLYQIMKRLDKTYSSVFEEMIKYFIENHPQIVFFTLRSFVESKELSMEKSLPKYLQPCYLILKKNHHILIQNLENLCDNLITHFRPSLEEDLYSCFSNLINSPVSSSIEEYKEIFDIIQQKFFSKDHEEFIDKYYEDFKLTFNDMNFSNTETVIKNMKK